MDKELVKDYGRAFARGFIGGCLVSIGIKVIMSGFHIGDKYLQ